MNAELRLRCAIGILASISLASPASRADADATAEALFREGRQLLAQGKLHEACPKLEQSARIDPSSGTLMNLAFCHAQLGKVATAWAEFLDAERRAIAQQNLLRAQEARRQAAALEPRLPRLTLRVAELLPGMVIRRNERTLSVSELGAPTPVDPGRYTLHAAAPGHVPWSVTLEVVDPGERVLEIPRLAPDRSQRADAPARAAARPQTGPRAGPIARRAERVPAARPHVLPATFWVTAATGVASAGVATVFGVLSLNNDRRAAARCPVPSDCDATGVRLSDRAYSQARVTNVAWAVAALAVGASVYIYFDSRPPRPRLTASVAAAD